MTATIERQRTTPAIAPQKDVVVFMAVHDRLRLVLEPIVNRYNPNGNELPPIPGRTVEFVDGVLRVPRKGMMTCVDGRQAPAAEILLALLGDPEKDIAPHRKLGDRMEGFWEHHEPAPAPTAEELTSLNDMAMDLDIEGLEAFLAAENGGWARAALVEVAEGSLARVRKTQERLEEDRAAALKEAEARGAAAAVTKQEPKV